MSATMRVAPGLLPAVAAVCAAALLGGGCAGRHPAAPYDARRSGEPSASIEEIATAIGCRPEVNVQAAELREASCETGQGDAYRMVTFATGQGLRSWLAEARDYGGTYLVGDRWVVTTRSAEGLVALRGRLGGSVENGDGHGGDGHGEGGHDGHAAAH